MKFNESPELLFLIFNNISSFNLSYSFIILKTNLPRPAYKYQTKNDLKSHTIDIIY